jgi:hypothetical protein
VKSTVRDLNSKISQGRQRVEDPSTIFRSYGASRKQRTDIRGRRSEGGRTESRGPQYHLPELRGKQKAEVRRQRTVIRGQEEESRRAKGRSQGSGVRGQRA